MEPNRAKAFTKAMVSKLKTKRVILPDYQRIWRSRTKTALSSSSTHHTISCVCCATMSRCAVSTPCLPCSCFVIMCPWLPRVGIPIVRRRLTRGAPSRSGAYPAVPCLFTPRRPSLVITQTGRQAANITPPTFRAYIADEIKRQPPACVPGSFVNSGGPEGRYGDTRSEGG